MNIHMTKCIYQNQNVHIVVVGYSYIQKAMKILEPQT